MKEIVCAHPHPLVGPWMESRQPSGESKFWRRCAACGCVQIKGQEFARVVIARIEDEGAP